MNIPGYSQQSQMKILRTTHQVNFRVGTRAVDLMAFLKHVPSEAKIIDISEGDSESGEMPYLQFEQESEENKDAR
jgi:hypothetical protein